jgi:hypothetical protein
MAVARGVWVQMQVHRGHVWGLTTLCLKPFMAATGANARQAVRRSGGVKGSEMGAALEAWAVQVATRQRQCNAVRTRKCAHRIWQDGRKGRGLRSTWETDACRDRSSLVLEFSMMHGVGEEQEELAGRGWTAARVVVSAK